MGLKERNYAAKHRIILLDLLGNKCARCGRLEPLQFDCIIPQGDKHHRFENSRRVSFYKKQFKNKNLQILCFYCNNEKAQKEDRVWYSNYKHLELPF